jgi:hypothetical protein
VNVSQVNNKRSCKILGLGDYSAYDRNRSWYSLTHTLKACDVPSDTLYNTSTIVHGGDHDRSRRDKD